MIRLSPGYDIHDLEFYEECNRSTSDRTLIDGLHPNHIYTKENTFQESILNDNWDLAGVIITEIIDDSLHIHYLYIRHDMRGLGIGKKVLHLLSERCRENKLDYISCVAFTNQSEQFFADNGFRIGEDDVTLILYLNNKTQ